MSFSDDSNKQEIQEQIKAVRENYGRASDIHVVLGDWQELLSVEVLTDKHSDHTPSFTRNGDTTYYKTSVKPEKGYWIQKDQVWSATKTYRGWDFYLLGDTVLEAEEKRCRLIEAYSLKETRKIIQKHCLSGACVEIVKCLRDGIEGDYSVTYKQNCLKIILAHFADLEKYLDLLPKELWPTYNEVLHHLNRKYQRDDEESSEEESSDDDSDD